MTKAFSNGFVPQTCGVGVSGVFRPDNLAGGYPLETLKNAGGAGWHIASFTDCPEHGPSYKKAYAELKAKWKIVYQTPVRKNTRTDRQFFAVMFDTRARSFKINNAQYGWPL